MRINFERPIYSIFVTLEKERKWGAERNIDILEFFLPMAAGTEERIAAERGETPLKYKLCQKYIYIY